MLAFPTHENGEPNVERKNHVFAFLPVRSFGFRFVIQADFLLVASTAAPALNLRPRPAVLPLPSRL